MDKTYLTEEKYKELTEELASLKTQKRKEVAERLEFAKSLGDLSENAEYHAAREEQLALEERIDELESLLKNAEIVSRHHTVAVEVGSSLVVRKEDEKEGKSFIMVGPEETDINSGKLSFQSPLGASLLGKRKGEWVVVRTPRGETKYQVVSIE